jgi:hypothetical protein
MNSDDVRPQLLLSVQRALLGEVFPSLRGVAVGWDSYRLHVVCYIDGAIADTDLERLQEVETEIAADFPADYEVQLDTIRCDTPTVMPSLIAWAFLRREEETSR